jgi:hypothetical protein
MLNGGDDALSFVNRAFSLSATFTKTPYLSVSWTMQLLRAYYLNDYATFGTILTSSEV